MSVPDEPPWADLELSWLHFNGRVLQEAADPSVPLFERLGFLGIFSSNLDEFFRVRVASLRTLLRLKKKRVRKLPIDPVELLRAIYRTVDAQQEAFGKLLRDTILPELEERGIHLVAEHELGAVATPELRAWFVAEVRPHLTPIPLTPDAPAPLLDDRIVHLVVEHQPTASTPLVPVPTELTLLPIPAPPVDRFVARREPDGRHAVFFLDDVIRVFLDEVLPGRHIVGAWAVKLSRDAELYLEDEFQGDVVAAMRRSLAKRETGTTARFLYDPATPVGVLAALRRALALEEEDLVPGGRYHNLHDLRAFPRCDATDGVYEPWSPLPHAELGDDVSVREAVARSDQLLHFPYHRYDHVVRFLTEAAADPLVEEIWLTVYRVSRESAVLRALLRAAEQGKAVHVFVEVKARFDEATNLDWAERLERAGIVTLFSSPDLKVHAKLALVVRREPEGLRRYAYLGTGNFNEETARFYTDFALLTADPALTGEVQRIFHFLSGDDEAPTFRHLMVAPFDLRQRLTGLIRAEAERAGRGEEAGITFKLNALEDEGVILDLYRAAQAGASIRGVVRGICRMVPGAPGWSERVELLSVVDRYLEHGRVYAFHNGGEPLVYLASADWMHRNLSRRVEVAFPVRDPTLRAQVLDGLRLQLEDTRKARVLDGRGLNRYAQGGGPPLRSQQAIRDQLLALAPTSPATP